MAEAAEATSYIIQELMTTEVTDHLANTVNTITTSAANNDVHTIQIQNDDTIVHGGNRGEVWTTEQTEKLITVVKENYHLITENNMRKGPFFKSITKYITPLMPSITPKQVENKWKNITYRFNRYEDNRINNLGMRLKVPAGYDLLRSFLELWGQESGPAIKSEPNLWKDDNTTPDIIISGPPEYNSSNSDDSDVGGNMKSNFESKGNVISIRHFMDEDADMQDDSVADNLVEFNLSEGENGTVTGDQKNNHAQWTSEATIAFIKLIKSNYSKIVDGGHQRNVILQEITRSLQSMIPKLTTRQVHTKWKNTKTRFHCYQQQMQRGSAVRKKKPVGYNLLCSFLKSDHQFRNGNSNEWTNDDDYNIDLGNSFDEEDLFSESENVAIKKIKFTDSGVEEATINISSNDLDNNDVQNSSGLETQKVLVWSRSATLRLLHLLKENFTVYQEKSYRRSPLFSKMAKIISSSDSTVTTQQVETKVKNLKSAYIRYQRGKLTGQKLKKPVGYTILDSLFGDQDDVKDLIQPQRQYDPGSPVNSIDISEFLTIPAQPTNSGNIRTKGNDEDSTQLKGANPAHIKKLISTIEINSKRIENKLDELLAGQERMTAAILAKNELLKKLIEDDGQEL